MHDELSAIMTITASPQASLCLYPNSYQRGTLTAMSGHGKMGKWHDLPALAETGICMRLSQPTNIGVLSLKKNYMKGLLQRSKGISLF